MVQNFGKTAVDNPKNEAKYYCRKNVLPKAVCGYKNLGIMWITLLITIEIKGLAVDKFVEIKILSIFNRKIVEQLCRFSKKI